MSENEVTGFGQITFSWNPTDENGEVLPTELVESPTNLVEDSYKLIHVLNQKSDSGRDQILTCVQFVESLIDGYEIPLNGLMTVETEDHKMSVKIQDYFSFVSSCGNIELTRKNKESADEIVTESTDWLKAYRKESEAEESEAESEAETA